MNKLSAYIVDDEKNSRIVLTDILSRFFPFVTILGEASNITEAYDGINETNPDIVFLDIQMPSGNGFTLLQKFEKIPFHVIFITGHHQYALQAFRFNALDYLLKPIDVEELEQSINKVTNLKLGSADYQKQILNAMQELDPTVETKKFAFHKNDSVHLVPINSVVSIEGDGRYSLITTIDNEKFTSSKTLKEYEEYLIPYQDFVRIHKETIININYVDQYSKKEPYWVLLTNKKEYEVSRRKKQEVLDLIKTKNFKK